MNEKISRPKSVFAITEKEEPSHWVRVGVAFANKDGSITIPLDALRLRAPPNPNDEEVILLKSGVLAGKRRGVSFFFYLLRPRAPTRVA